MSESKIKPNVKAKAEGKTKFVKAKSSPNHSPAMDMIKAAIKSSQDITRMSLILIKEFIQQHYNVNIEKNDDIILRVIKKLVQFWKFVNMVRWAVLHNIDFEIPSCQWAPGEGWELVRNPSCKQNM